MRVPGTAAADHRRAVSRRDIDDDGEPTDPRAEQPILDRSDLVRHRLSSAYTNHGNDVAATNPLQAFINSVQAQRGVTISSADADALIAAAQEIIAALS